MKFYAFKYVLITCIALTFFIKVSHVVSYLSYSADNIEALSTHDDATEKEEKKVETEYAIEQVAFHGQTYFPVLAAKKLIITNHPFSPAYFPEVSTPPPSV